MRPPTKDDFKKSKVVIAEGELQSAEVIGVEGKRVHIGVVMVQVIALHKRDFEQEKGTEKAEEKVTSY